MENIKIPQNFTTSHNIYLHMIQQNAGSLDELVKCISILNSEDSEVTPMNSRFKPEKSATLMPSQMDTSQHKSDLKQLQQITDQIRDGVQDPVSQITRMINTLDKYRNNSGNHMPQHIYFSINQNLNNRRQSKVPWSAEEHVKFLDGVEMFGRKKHTLIAKYIGTKETTQVISHSQKYFIKLEQLFNQILSQNVVPNYNKDLIVQQHPVCRDFDEIRIVDRLLNTKQLYQIDGRTALVSRQFYVVVNHSVVQIKQLYCGVFHELQRVKASIEFIAEKFVKDRMLVLLTLLM